jgi:hypothetical protein
MDSLASSNDLVRVCQSGIVSSEEPYHSRTWRALVMNKLENAILDGAVKAHEVYEGVSGGGWLWHAPESFILPFVAIEVAEEGFLVYPETSPKKLNEELGVKKRGKPRKNVGERFDLVIWYKSNEKVRCIVEVKRSQNIHPVRTDADKVRKHLSQGVAKTGYVLVYCEADGDEQVNKLREKFEYWAEETGSGLVGHHIDPEGNGEWTWGFVLLRLDQE